MAPSRRLVGWGATCVALAACLSVAAAGCVVSEPPRTSAAVVGVPGLANEYVSSASAGSWVALAWSASSDGTGTNVYAAVSRDEGRSFGAPVRVNAVERQASINGEQPPRIVLVGRDGEVPRIVVVWTAKLDEGTALLRAESIDGGQSFGSSAPLPGGQAAGNRGWQSVAASADGRVYAVWLDHRDTATTPGATHSMHQHGSSAPAAVDGVARAQLSQLFVGTLDGSVPATSVARGVCYCCKTSVLVGSDGAVYAAWRHVYPGNHRDIAVAVSRGAGAAFAEPVRVSDDRWHIEACPENGPSLAMDATNRLHVLWPTLVTDGGRETLKLFSSWTIDGTTFAPRAELPTSGAAYHPQIVAGTDGRLYAAWDEVQPGRPRRVRLARAHPEASNASFAAVDLGDDAAGSYPTLAATPSRLVLAWTARNEAESTILVRTIPY